MVKLGVRLYSYSMKNAKPFSYFLLSVFISFYSCVSFSQTAMLTQKVSSKTCQNNICDLLFLKVADENEFAGLASYYNNINYYLIDKNHIKHVENGVFVILEKEQWLAAVGRYKVFLVKSKGLEIDLSQNKVTFLNESDTQSSHFILKVINKTELLSVSRELDQLRYVHLYTPLSWLAKMVEFTLTVIQANIVNNWGIVIIIFSFLVKFFLIPVSVLTVRLQRKASQVQSLLAPRLAEIKAKYDGEEAHKHLMTAHKELGVTPFYTLKPMLGSFIQIPILIAIFNALGEMQQFDGQSFLWVQNLAYPDSVAYLSFTVPMFGSALNLLPILMALVSLAAIMTFQNSAALITDVKKQKRNLYFMTAVFFVLFYPFPAVMVLYWMLANLLQLIQQKFIKI